MTATSIEWTNHSINPFRARDQHGHVGHYCEKISGGCKNCWASVLQKRFQMPEYCADKRNGVEVFLDESKLDEVLRRKKPTKYFWCDMTDMFLDCYPDEWIDRCFAVMTLTPQHTHQILTKRPERMRRYVESRSKSASFWKSAISDFGYATDFQGISLVPFPLPNVHKGVSVEDQPTADDRIPILLQTPAAVHWVSYEPGIGPVDFRALPVPDNPPFEFDALQSHDDEHYYNVHPKLDWVVIGGESGKNARTFNIQWARDVIAQCKAAGVPCFVKQLGRYPFREDGIPASLLLGDRKGADMSEWPEDLKVREYPEVRQ